MARWRPGCSSSGGLRPNSHGEVIDVDPGKRGRLKNAVERFGGSHRTRDSGCSLAFDKGAVVNDLQSALFREPIERIGQISRGDVEFNGGGALSAALLGRGRCAGGYR
jgi:hypothetical protein